MNRMTQRGLGDLSVSALGLGFMSFVRSTDAAEQRQARALVDEAIDHGVTLFDTADVYGPETSEILLGRALAGRRDAVVLATKFGNALDRDTNPAARVVDARPEYVRAAIDASLRRLGTDHVDLYYLHRVDPTVPIEDTVGALSELVQAGKVRHIGLSEAGPGTIRRAHATHPLAALQNEWSLFSRELESVTVPLARELGIGIVPYSPLGRGWLTGAVRSLDDVSPRQRRHPRFAPETFETNRRLADEVAAIATEVGARPGQVALAWVLAQGDDVVPIPGTHELAHLRENLGAADVRLEPEHLDRLEGIAARVVGQRSPRPAGLGTEAPPANASP